MSGRPASGRPVPPLRVHAVVPSSRANGPGARAVVWVQGCTLGCHGCFNPETHERAGESVEVDDLLARLVALEDGIEGLTVSGGEPLQQRRAVLALLSGVRASTALSVLVFTGYRLGEVERMPELPELRACVDVLVAGRYEHEHRLATGLRGSANQTVHRFTDRYTASELEEVPPAEVVIGADGRVVVTGVDPPDLGALAAPRGGDR